MSAWAVTGLSKAFAVRGWRGTERHAALDAATLSVAPGERVGLIGCSGSGKTTLVRCGLGLGRPDAGTITVLGEDATHWTSARWRQARRTVQVLFQDPRSTLHPRMTIGTLLEESATLHRPDDDPVVAVAECLAAVGLAGRQSSRPHQLSGGERRRAGIARVLLARPQLVVADEPTSGLDAALKADTLQLLLDRVGPHCAVVIVSHDLAAVAWACHRVVVLDAGRVVETFATGALHGAWRPAHPTTQALLAASGWAKTGQRP